MSTFISYVFLGLSLAAPIGPINAAQLEKGIRNGFFHSWFVGLGAIIADAFYMGLVYLGFVHFLEKPIIQAFLWSFGCFVLIYTGVESLIGAGKISTKQSRVSEPLSKSFLSGFFMSISNPLTILFWLGIYGSVLAKTVSNYNMDQLILYSGAMFSGLLIWDLSMALLASTFRQFLSRSLLTSIAYLSGLSLIGFGIYFGIEAIKTLFFF
ncbi:LysE family transporter [Bacillus marasmi]|uniref:LysE family transporter n=1 Tax=Bacillus marasmi TaxID=1926279 RepID=UPI0011CAC05A|nr:LysE family transporter [Bacillus marasmi]